MGRILLYLGAALPLVWGVAHLFPTRAVVESFGQISTDNRRIITMEWINEGVTLIFIGVLVACVTALGGCGAVSVSVYMISAAALLALAVVSVFTGFKVAFFPFKLCPFFFTASAVLIVTGSRL